MSTRQSLKRVANLEERMCPQSDGMWTLEELCRSLWRKNKKRFMEIAKNTSYQLFVYQFQREDADALLNHRRSGRSPTSSRSKGAWRARAS
jgi:hypothetical protein